MPTRMKRHASLPGDFPSDFHFFVLFENNESFIRAFFWAFVLYFKFSYDHQCGNDSLS
jgi:hypothetical protein